MYTQTNKNIFSKLDGHLGKKNVFKSEHNLEISLKYANFANFGPPF